jgi:NADH-quinone oxidoreductase subunit J
MVVAAQTAQNIFFYLMAVVMIVAAIRVVTTRNVVHAALFLIVVFAGVAGQFILLAAEFVAITQVLIYIGAIMVLMLFGIMLTRARIGRESDLTHEYWYVGLLTALLTLGVMGYALIDGYEDTPLNVANADQTRIGNTAQVSDSIFSQYLIPFEAVSVLLLAALIGAIVLARKD